LKCPSTFGPGRYVDQVDVQINKFEPGPVKPLIAQTGPRVVKQVRIHYPDGTDCVATQQPL
jgi:hypothetical protein